MSPTRYEPPSGPPTLLDGPFGWNSPRNEWLLAIADPHEQQHSWWYAPPGLAAPEAPVHKGNFVNNWAETWLPWNEANNAALTINLRIVQPDPEPIDLTIMPPYRLDHPQPDYYLDVLPTPALFIESMNTIFPAAVPRLQIGIQGRDNQWRLVLPYVEPDRATSRCAIDPKQHYAYKLWTVSRIKTPADPDHFEEHR